MKEKIYKVLIFAVFLSVLSILIIFGFLVYISLDLPSVSDLANYNPSIPSQIFSKDGHVLLSIGKEKREVASIQEIPQLVINAFLSSEDSNFYDHNGVDYSGMLRAFVANIKAKKIVQGGSTITQQVAKSLLLSREKSFVRKFKDIMLAQKIEKEFSKEEILFLYLNHIYLGGGYYGVKAAFKGYFDKDLDEATIAECALIAGLPVAPGKYSPYNNPRYSKLRQIYVLGRMLKDGKITKEQHDEALNEKIKIRIRHFNKMQGGHFTDWVRQRIVNLVGEESFLTKGFKVVTTLNWELQKIAEKEVLDGVKEIDKRQGFKGPINSLNGEAQINKFIKIFRDNFFKELSHFFYFTAEGTKEYEMLYSESEYLEIEKEQKEKKDKYLYKNFVSGVVKDRLRNYLKIGDNYEAVVLKVEDRQRIVYVSIGGVRCVIPYEYYRWAHERKIDENRNIFPYVTKPSTILEKGDVILVKLLKSPRSLWPYLDKNYKKYLTNEKLIQIYKEQQFYLCLLDQEPEAEGSLVAISVGNNEIISLVGGKNFSKSQFNRALQSHRQPGSSFKPIIYAAALENGFTPTDKIIDSPEALGGINENLSWKPRNYDGLFKGAITLRTALETSRNVPTIKLAADVGVKGITEFVKRIGLDVELEKDLSLALGSFGVTLLDLVSAYAIFVNGGKKISPKSIISITDHKGKNYSLDLEDQKKDTEETKDNHMTDDILKEIKEEEKNPYTLNLHGDQVYDPRLSYLMANLLKGVINNGTGRRAKSIGTFIGGKTGTTNNYVDAWFLGFSSDVVTGVWTGLDDNKTLGWGETGAKSALPIWKNYMKAILKHYGENDFKVPKGIINVLIDKETGEIFSENNSTNSNNNAFMESFVEGTGPGTAAKKENEAIEEETGDNKLLDEDDFF